MTPDIAICLTILAVAVLLFAWDRVPADVVALGVMLAVIVTGLLPADKAFAGFGSDTVMMILGLLVMSAGLIQTGVVEIAGRYVFEVAGRNPAIFLPVIMVSVATVSAFMSNTAATAFFVPLVIGYATKIGASPVEIPAAACLRLHPDQLRHADQHLDQPGGERPSHPLSAAADGHVRACAGRHPDRRRRPPLCLGDRRAPDPAA